ncbi:MAG: hypothetical protein AB8B58_12810 [Roseobacter sp.]
MTEADLPLLDGAFEAVYARQFICLVPGMTVKTHNCALSVSAVDILALKVDAWPGRPLKSSDKKVKTWCDVTARRCQAGVFDRADLHPWDRIQEPALITELQTITRVSVDFQAFVSTASQILLERQESPSDDI